MKELFALVTTRDIFMLLIGGGLVFGLYFIFTAIHDAWWTVKESRRPFDGRK